jgi:SAM-dependent methyltransferase
MNFSDKDKANVINRYTHNYSLYGHSQKAVGWGEKGRQELRFSILSSLWNFKNASVLDIGAGFGDFYNFIGKDNLKEYHGFDIVPVLVEKGNELYGSNKNFKLSLGNFMEMPLEKKYDIVVISGLFNFKLTSGDNYYFINDVLTKALSHCNIGVAANFITDRVDHHDEVIFNSSPEKIVEIALKHTKNFILRNDYMPFEFSIFLNKDDSFSASDAIFNSYKNSGK